MNKTLLTLALATCMCLVGCRVKYGCPTNVRNTGAEKLLTDEKLANKAAKDAAKFKNRKF